MKARTLLLIRAAASNLAAARLLAASNLDTAESLLAEALHDLDPEYNKKDNEENVELLEFG